MFWRAGVPFLEPIPVTESKVLYFATVAEYMIESTRPQTNQMKYFGSPHALTRTEPLNISHALNISSISPAGIIVVSFGSVTSGQHIPVDLIRIFMSVFRNLSHTVIWQFGSEPNTKGVPVPSNVHLYDWLPLAQLLACPDVRMLIGHGGIRSMLEAIHQGLPLLGIPIQGVQYHDLKRITEQGVAEMISIPDITETSLAQKLDTILSNYKTYKGEAERLSSEIREFYGDLYQTIQPNEFWIQWAVRHGRSLKNSKNFHPLSSQSFMIYYSLDVVLVSVMATLIVLIASSRLISRRPSNVSPAAPKGVGVSLRSQYG